MVKFVIFSTNQGFFSGILGQFYIVYFNQIKRPPSVKTTVGHCFVVRNDKKIRHAECRMQNCRWLHSDCIRLDREEEKSLSPPNRSAVRRLHNRTVFGSATAVAVNRLCDLMEPPPASLFSQFTISSYNRRQWLF